MIIAGKTVLRHFFAKLGESGYPLLRNEKSKPLNLSSTQKKVSQTRLLFPGTAVARSFGRR
jgi:hypothetical protein